MTDGEVIGMQAYCDFRIEGLRRELVARLDAMEKATTVAADNLQRQLEGLDVDGKFLTRTEFGLAHEKLLDDVKSAREKMITRDEYTVTRDSLNTYINDLQQRVSKAEGKASMQDVYIGWGIGIIGLVIGAVALFH